MRNLNFRIFKPYVAAECVGGYGVFKGDSYYYERICYTIIYLATIEIVLWISTLTN